MPGSFRHVRSKFALAVVPDWGILGRMNLEEIASEASKLTEEERASLASRLLHGLKTPVYDVADNELSERMREGESDPTVWLTFDQLVDGLRHRVR